MGQEIDADTSYEVNDNHNTTRMPSVYKTLALGWVLAVLVFVIKFYFISLHSYSLLIFHPLVWIFIFCVTFIQYKFAAELETSKPTWGSIFRPYSIRRSLSLYPIFDSVFHRAVNIIMCASWIRILNS